MSDFNINRSIEVLKRTPLVVESLLLGLSDEWIKPNEGEQTWSPYDIIGHLIHGEKTDWMQRLEIILSDHPNKTFKPFDRFAQFENSNGAILKDLLDQFKKLRTENIKKLTALDLKSNQFSKEGVHPEFGPVTLSQLLSTWVVHDLNHINQITRVMAHQYRGEVGPWKAYLKVLKI